MNEHGLTNRLRDWFNDLHAAGLPIRAYKNHGSAFSRDRPDWFICVCGLFVAIETKNPEDPKPPTKMQERELRELDYAEAETLVSHDLDECKRFVARLLQEQGHVHRLTEPYL